MGLTFDSLEYFEKLKDAGMPEKAARIQAEAMRIQAEEFRSQAAAQEKAFNKKLEDVRAELVTKDYLDARLKDGELRLLKWQIGIGITIVAIMAKGFGWIGF